MGVVSPLGCDLECFTRGLLAGQSAAGPITIFDPASLPTRIAAEVDADSLPFKTRDRKIAFGIIAARRAIQDAESVGETIKEASPQGLGVLSLGLGLELFSMPDMVDFLAEEKIPENRQGDRLTFLQTPADSVVQAICGEHGLHHPPLLHISACAASTDAIGEGFRLLQEGSAEWALAGGLDSMINPLGLGGFCKIAATTRRNTNPPKASRPFDKKRDGFLLGEGSGLLVLETMEGAEARGARIYAEILGYGNSFDAHGISEPHPEGEGAFLAMQRALKDARLRPEQISYVNAHGTSTPKNDPVETFALRRLLGAHADAVPVSSTKSMIGHLISAAGAVELAGAVLCARVGKVHPTINLETPDPECDLDYVPEGARRHRVEYMLKNSFGFGGQNASLVLRVNPREVKV
jgi:3-oxoacyl-[acyl-carrier-protein] synthase II